ncbi:MAG: hypothetical protein Q3972_06555 [Corynebacterium sp.]|nr:hypothetical protein [Corynebacterium sp.]
MTAALSSFAVIFLAPHVLDPNLVSQFQALWGFFFALTGLIDGLQHETTRATTRPSQSHSFPHRFTAILAAVIAGVSLLAAPAWLPALVPDSPHHTALALAFAASVALYVGQSVLLGTLSGHRLWNYYAAITAIDATIRVVAAVAILLLIRDQSTALWAFLLLTIMGPITWLPFLFFRKARGSLLSTIDVPPAVFLRRLLLSLVASGATAGLVNGFSAATKAWGTAGTVPMAAIIMAVLLSRAPIIIPAQRFQAALINYLARHKGTSILRAPVILTLGILLLMGAGALVGPWFLTTMWGPAYYVRPAIIAALVLGAVIQGALFITGSRAIAHAHHWRYCAGWVAATTLSFLIIALPLPTEVTVPTALIMGPLLGIIIHLFPATAAGK